LASADLAILLPAFLAGLLVLSTHVPLGQLVIERPPHEALGLTLHGWRENHAGIDLQ
jgi:hypothetical protein